MVRRLVLALACLVSPLLLGVVRASDARLPDARSLWQLGLLDVPAHAVTSVLLGLAIVGFLPLRTGVLVLVGCVAAGSAIDLDHVPAMLGSDVLTRGTLRPYPHSALTVVACLAVGICLPGPLRAVMAGAAVGLTGHLARDAALGGVPLVVPQSLDLVQIPYAVYADGLTLTAQVALASGAVLVVRALWVRWRVPRPATAPATPATPSMPEQRAAGGSPDDTDRRPGVTPPTTVDEDTPDRPVTSDDVADPGPWPTPGPVEATAAPARSLSRRQVHPRFRSPA